VTAGNVGASVCCCAGLAGDDDASGCAGVAGGDEEGAFCAGVVGGDADGACCAGALRADVLGCVALGADVLADDRESSDCVAPCSAGGVAWARTSLAPAAASAA